ncbi:hypothetical protein Ahy_A01g000590 isoform B [Arachis hypogaea]|uniref:Uncharacterized protein n=1 Tax=Arachis hypogaea TaxID=3818 RepID=A0A445EKL1_ARAHY|nr:hypothetical protein Ahy_A01g000590 isoform B [Arachis hypogaea]
MPKVRASPNVDFIEEIDLFQSAPHNDGSVTNFRASCWVSNEVNHCEASNTTHSKLSRTTRSSYFRDIRQLVYLHANT